MSTAPCLFQRPPGTELFRKGKVGEGHDLAACRASRDMGQSKTHPPLYLEFVTDDPTYRDHSRAKRVRVGEEVRYLHWANLEVISIDLFAENRGHLLCRESSGHSLVIIENYNFKSGKGDYWEFRKLIGIGVGVTFLIDPNRAFPLDSMNTGTIIQARFTEDVEVAQIERLLREHGYRVATTEEELDYQPKPTTKESFCYHCLNQEGELIQVDWNRAFRVEPDGIFSSERYLRIQKLPVVNGQVAA